jgi:integrase
VDGGVVLLHGSLLMAGRRALLPGELGAVQVSPAPKGGFAGRAYTRDGGGEKKRLYARSSASPCSPTSGTAAPAGAVDHARTALNGALGVAVEDGVIDHNPLLSLRKRKGQKGIPTALTVEQVRVLREVVRAREERVRPRAGASASASALRWTIELQLGSSYRVSEVLALRNVDHDRDNGCIAVTGTMVDDEGWQ